MESLIGQTLDSYKILEIIGRGGMGVVFRALDTNLDKIVALKMIDPTLAKDESFVRRFKTEARALAKLDNPNIVGVYALRETRPYFFMVMEFVEARPLSQYIRDNGKLKLKDMVKGEEKVKEYLTGIAKRLNDDGLKVSSEILIGKPADEIVDYVSENPFNLIAMTTHGHSGLTRWAFGSVADRVLHSTHSPVLIVRPN